MPEDKKKKHTNKGSAGVRKSHNPLSNAMTNRREKKQKADTPALKPKKQKLNQKTIKRKTSSQRGKHKRLKMAPMPTRSEPIKPKDNKTEDPVWV